MVKLEDAVIARLETHGERYEVLVDPDLALELKHGKEVDVAQVLAVDTIFKDSKKGDKASEERIKQLFGTSNPLEVAKIIIKKGEIQLTTEQRRKMQEDRKKQIIAIIARHAINPQTNAPHPPQRIEKAMEEARVHVDLSKTAEEQVQQVLKVLRPIIPIRFEERTVAARIPAQYAGKAYSVVKSFGEIKKEEWQKDGSWIILMNLPAGVVDEFFEALNSLTKGEVGTKIVK
ncbi:MAG: ribosome assembly factor SBDS [Euryarchaeota archaeon]|nr:ribosome assembly factor SBDS [Euryarchaeota archaeon]